MIKPSREKPFRPLVPILLVLVLPEAAQADFRVVLASAAVVLAVDGNFLYCIN
ncbi:MAG: hypothetical protein ACJAU2_000747 [Maribacter sp.]|jgi:hypothetical protein